MNREQNDWVSFLKELMEFVLSSSNHLIGIGPKIGWKNSTQQSLVLRMDSHLLFELAHVLYRIRVTVIHGECWLMKTPGKLCLFYSPGEG